VKEYTSEQMVAFISDFVDGKSESRPIIFQDVVMWVDENQKLHRENGPAVERNNGQIENWIHGARQE